MVQPLGGDWGEVQRGLPGDERVPKPRLGYTRAITIGASPAQVWSWLVQIGHGKGGMYSYDQLENLVGCQMHSVDEIVPEYQHLKVGDVIRLGPKGYPLYKVIALEPHRLMIVVGADPKTEEAFDPFLEPLPDSYVNYSWLFFLEAVDERTTRLISRMRMDYRPRNIANWMIWRFFSEPLNFVMERKMLMGIKSRAEWVERGRSGHSFPAAQN